MNRPKLPEVREQRVEGHCASLALTLQPDLIHFEGHFPGLPILPAVAQFAYVVSFAQSLLGVTGTVAGMSALKFRRPLRPGEQIELELDWQASERRLVFVYRCNREAVTSGRIRYRP
jgi:3-hydroxymyristoyl/3-hydroxydecanoyl-(acyl carrier protein) dehydratase